MLQAEMGMSVHCELELETIRAAQTKQVRNDSRGGRNSY